MPRGENNRKLSDQDIEEVIRMYTTPNEDGTWTGVTTIARHFGVRHNTIPTRLKSAGVAMRTMKEAHRNMKISARYVRIAGVKTGTGKRCKPIKNVPQGEPPLCACGCGEPTDWDRRSNAWYKFKRGHYHRTDRPFHDREWLFDQYVTRRKSTNAIAKMCNVTGTTIKRYLTKFNIPTRGASESKLGLFEGSKNPAWKGGVTPIRQRLYKTQKWSALVASVLARDNYTCARCGTYRATAEPKLVTHHIRPFADHPELRFDPDNLVTLCEKCHRWVHSRANKRRDFLK